MLVRVQGCQAPVQCNKSRDELAVTEVNGKNGQRVAFW